jgi:hypothetical protein
VSYTDYIRSILSSEFGVDLGYVETNPDNTIKNLMYPVYMGHTAREKVVVTEVEVNSISVLYSVEFHNLKEEIRIYYPDNLSPRDCVNRYHNKTENFFLTSSKIGVVGSNILTIKVRDV